VADERPEPARQPEDLASLQKDIALTEARGALAEAQGKLAEAESKVARARQPWWRSGLTVTTLAAIVSAVVPLTAQINSWRDQALKEKEKNFEIRDKYLATVIRDPRHEQRVLEFIVATADDLKIRTWAVGQLNQAKEKVAILENRKKFYLETIGVVGELADRGATKDNWEKQLTRFWHLYKTDLLPVESPEVEGLMVQIGHTLGTCRPGQCPNLEGLAYQLARQMKAEIRADASPAAAPAAMPPQPAGSPVQP
jgi:hypothetical protein